MTSESRVVYENSSTHCNLDHLSLGTLALDFVSSVGPQAYDTKMMVLPCSKRAFSDVLEGLALKSLEHERTLLSSLILY